mgnify:CR=1 FL=1
MMRAAQRLLEEKSSYATVAAPCPVFGACGGCALQDLAYHDQLALKLERVRRAFAPFDAALPIEMVGLEDPWRYRNKAEFTFAAAQGRLTLGYHERRSFTRIVDLEDCLLLPSPAMAAAREVVRLAAETGLPAYHPRTHQGFFRYLLVRHSHATGKTLLCVMTTPGSRQALETIARGVMARHPHVASVYWGITSTLADIAVPDALQLLEGEAHLEDRVGPFVIRLHPMSFLQPSSVQADRMYEHVCRALKTPPPSVAWDLYCGLGLVGLYLSRSAGRVYAIDSEPHHVELAAANASLNGRDNIAFHAGRVETLLQDRRFWLQDAKPDVIVVDPPRAGLHLQALSSMLAARPGRIAYVSCNVQSLVRDLQVLVGSFPRYRLAQVTAFDMFPQTNHTEIFVLLERV